MNSPDSTPLSSQRLASLDILRGFDLFLLVFFQPVLISIGSHFDTPFMQSILYQFDHEVWEGFRFWDLVMPLFLFMAGVSMPFSFEKYRRLPDKGAIYRKILRRFFLLFLLGMVVQGNLLGLDPAQIYLYSNTLQAIATGYLIASIILLHCSLKMQLAIAVLLLIVYSVPISLCGDFTPAGNFAEQVDRQILRCFRDGVVRHADGTWSFDPNYTYTWIWSSLTFGVTVLSGVFAGELMKRATTNRKRTALLLCVIGLALVILAWCWSFQMPVIKRIWSGSMVLLSSGYCFLLMALFYYVIDVCGYTKGLNWLRVYGMNSITAYVLGEVINFRSVAASVSYGLEQYLGSFYSTWLTFLNFLILFFILQMMYKHRCFIKL